jgi:hypothetical protein
VRQRRESTSAPGRRAGSATRRSRAGAGGRHRDGGELLQAPPGDRGGWRHGRRVAQRSRAGGTRRPPRAATPSAAVGGVPGPRACQRLREPPPGRRRGARPRGVDVRTGERRRGPGPRPAPELRYLRAPSQRRGAHRLPAGADGAGRGRRHEAHALVPSGLVRRLPPRGLPGRAATGLRVGPPYPGQHRVELRVSPVGIRAGGRLSRNLTLG